MLVDPQVRVLGAVVHRDFDDDSIAVAGHERAVYRETLDETPFAAGSPILVELVVRIVAVFLGMLAPIGIIQIDGISCFKVLRLDGGKELVHRMTLRIVAIVIGSPGKDDNQHNANDHEVATTPVASRVVLLRIKQRHALSIAERAKNW